MEEMKRNLIGASDVEVSRIGLGGYELGQELIPLGPAAPAPA
jgi:hypothetical protein